MGRDGGAKGDDPTVDGGLANTALPTELGLAHTQEESEPEPFVVDPRYQRLKQLGVGGMGEVLLCRDRKIERSIAIKLMRSDRQSRNDLRERFVHEARIQAQLEHPAVVPVYDIELGESPAFTMKRVQGRDLASIIRDLRRGQEAVTKQFGPRRLLSAFSSVCLAVDFAHSRGVLHRDLKPANIMLGDFGEVYVLDWGLAKLSDVEEPQPSATGSLSQSGSQPQTAMGSVLGTPGYMAPEQARGEDLDTRADIYSLGSILFEILAHEAMVHGESAHERLQATLCGGYESPSLRRPDLDIPPELELLCQTSVSLEPTSRPQSARELSEAIESYLDGDRDQRRRIELSLEHSVRAHEHAEQALAGRADFMEQRRRAIDEANRALALDPSNDQAGRTILRLLETPPTTLPQEVEHAQIERRLETVRSSAKAAIWLFSTAFLYYPLAYWMGFRAPLPLIAWTASSAAYAVGVSVYASRTRQMPGFGIYLSCVLVATTGSCAGIMIFGPLVVMPQLLLANLLGFLLIALPGWRLATCAVHALAILIPYALQGMGVVEPWYSFRDGTMVIVPRWLDLPEAATTVTILFVTFVVAATACYFVIRTRKELDEAQTRLDLYAWHFRPRDEK